MADGDAPREKKKKKRTAAEDEAKAAKKARKEKRREMKAAAAAAAAAAPAPAPAPVPAPAAPSPAAVSAPARPPSRPDGSSRTAEAWRSQIGPCNLCGQMGHLGRTCPQRTCYECGGTGHLAKHCPKKRGCAHCGSTDHPTNLCTYGARDGEDFLYCDTMPTAQPQLAPRGGGPSGANSSSAPNSSAAGSPCGCSGRRFILPLRLGRPAFDLADLRDGRMDVAASYAPPMNALLVAYSSP